MNAPIAGWDESTWPDAAPPCPRCGHDRAAETVALRRRAVTADEHHELVGALLAGDDIELAPWDLAADRDALRVGYGAVLAELAATALAHMTETEIRQRLGYVLLPAAVLDDYRAELNRQRALHEAAGIDLVRATVRRVA